MGVPKFFRYISERYPCLSEVVKDYQIPEFDNLYLDMNGIIHNCSHPNDDDPHFRITEEKIFQDIFHYIEVLFRMIKPQKLFFMAIDGVAPRAKMNQQRGRRFRSAADAAKAEAEAVKKGETLPTEARFDSNCITPGTVFMDRLHQQLKYFVVDKISNDPMWQKCKVILSGHETPGEGEHKIMDYIRFMRAQSSYDPNTRHCLYGLDADLIMLGLCTHEPHFSLLREEVKFGKKSTKRITVPEEITFFLLHLSLLREYLELEFTPVKYQLSGFDYDFEKIIDDWVLMGFLVGNDFIPNLPNMHIADGALPILYKTYMEVLPTLSGYINEGGTLNLKRFEAFLEKLGLQDVDFYEQIKDDLTYLESKRGRKCGGSTKELEECETENDDIFGALKQENLTAAHKDSGLANLLKSADDLCIEDDTDDISDDDFVNFKRDYYKQKLEYTEVTPEVMRDQAEGFVRAIQWNLNYYYNGCCSWSWFYPHHYSPYISDIKGFSDSKIEFDMGKPFFPYEQLLAVLPAASKELLPECYHSLMTDENSLIIDYYPENFETDLNGKRQAWEAVVKIPFIDEKRLLDAMSYCNDKLTTEERRRNCHGPMMVNMYTPRNNGPYPAPCYFPEIPKNHTELKTLLYKDVLVARENLVKGPYPGAHMNIYYPGFPTMKHLKYKGELVKAHVKVFEQPSRNENMIVRIIPNVNLSTDMIPVDLLGITVFVAWPHLIEGKVVSISNFNRKFISMGGPNEYNTVDLTESDKKQFNMSISDAAERYKTRMGIIVGETKVLVYVKQLIGRKFIFNTNGKLCLEKQFAQHTSCHPLQTVVFNISAHDPQSNVVKDVETIFPKNSICFTLTNPYYGSQGVIQESSQAVKSGRIKISISVLEEPNLNRVSELQETMFRKYKTTHTVASPLCISNVLFSKITGSIFVKVSGEPEAKRVNIGLDLKLNKKNKETPGYTKKVNNYWFYTDKAADLVREYTDKFPEVLEFLSRNSGNDDYGFDDIFTENSEERLKTLQQWLKTLPTHSVEKQLCNSLSLEPEIIEELEKTIDSFKSGSVKKVTMQVKPNFLYRPEVQNGTLEPDVKTETQLLDRIVNVRYGYTVPFGFKGTVTAVRTSTSSNDRDTMYEVVFDKPFRDGLTLNCSENRGYMLPKTAFINISHGQRLMIEKTGKPGELITNSEGTSHQQHNNYNNYFNNLIKPQPQPSIQRQQKQQWYPPPQQIPPFYLPPQDQQPMNQPNSAFAHFSSSNIFRKPPFLGPENKDKNNLDEFFISRKQGEKVTNETKNVDTQDNQKERLVTEDTRDFNTTHDQKGIESDQKVQKNEKSNLLTEEIPQEYYGKSYKKLMKPDDFRPPSKDVEENWSQQSYKPNFDSNHRQKGYQQDKKKSSNYFMPNFGETDSYQSKDNANRPQTSENTSKINYERKAPPHTVDTDFLKTILGIGKTEEQSTNKDMGNKENVVNVSNKVKDEVKSSNVSFDMLAQVAKIPASVRLLTYYQSNQLGLPRYQYFPVQHNKVKAQITLNDGALIVGEPAKTREDASESVAAIVLDALLKKGKSLESIDKRGKIPAPPTNWVQSGTKSDQSQSTSAQQPKHISKAAQSEATAVFNNSFVPLQVVKNHISKTSSSSKQNDSIKEVGSASKKGKQHQLDNGEKANILGTSSRDSRKPKKERKIRIAANFVKH